MNHQEKLEAIRKACVEANPDIVELKFGCLISGYGHHLSKIVTTDEKYCSFLHNPNLVAQDRTKTIKQDYQIIGRPIRLVDVMLAIGRREDKVHISCDGWFCVLQVPTMQFARRAQWDLRNDDLSEQSEETVDFIHGLLKGV